MKKEHKKTIGGELAKTNNMFSRILMEQTNYTVSPTQLRIIIYLLHHNNTCMQKEIEDFFDIRRSTATGILTTMEKNKIIIRRQLKSDARQKEIVLTDKAIESSNELRKNREKFEKIIKKGISKEELEIFYSVLEKIRQNVSTINKKEERKKQDAKVNV